jgi:hypothetical protein
MDVKFQVARQFQGPQLPLSVRPMGRGHINDTFLVEYADGPDHVMQRLNTYVFPKPDWVMDNIRRVTEHLQSKVHGLPHAELRSLRVVPTKSGQSLYRDDSNGCWRMYPRLQPVQSFDQLQTTQQAYFTGRSFGEFQALLADLPAPRLHETIADFHHTPKRLARLLEVASGDPTGRKQSARAELDFAQARQQRVEHLIERHLRGEIPERTTHNDTKLNNLLFDERGETPLCVVDLDTVMPGLVHYDFGDMVRTGCATAPEDEPVLEKVDFSRELFRSMTEGYLEAGRGFLRDAEVEELAFSGILMTLEVGIRFLTDYLEGDVYFKVHHPEHNLQRARSQFALVARLEAAEAELSDLVGSLWQKPAAPVSRNGTPSRQRQQASAPLLSL